MLQKHNLIEKEEKIILLIQHHWFIPFKIIIRYLFIAFIPYLGYLIINKFSPESLDQFSENLPNLILILFLSSYYLFVLLFFFHSWLDYYLDIWIITNQRVIDIEQKGLFSRKIAEHKLSRIQDVSSEVQGFFPTILFYGNIKIQTAGEEQLFILENIPCPQELARKILELAKNVVQHEDHSN